MLSSSKKRELLSMEVAEAIEATRIACSLLTRLHAPQGTLLERLQGAAPSACTFASFNTTLKLARVRNS